MGNSEWVTAVFKYVALGAMLTMDEGWVHHRMSQKLRPRISMSDLGTRCVALEVEYTLDSWTRE